MKKRKDKTMDLEKEMQKIRDIPPVKSKTGNLAEDIRLIIAEWLADKHIRYKTDYTSGTVAHAVSLFQTIADRHKIQCIKDWLRNYRIDNLSIERKSSEELVQILKERMVEDKKDNGIDTISKFLE